MSFDALEVSAQSGEPIELYRFSALPTLIAPVELWRENFALYPNTAALLAVWDTEVEPSPTATWTLDGTRALDGAACLRLHRTGATPLGLPYILSREVAGLPPSTTLALYEMVFRTGATGGAVANAWDPESRTVVTSAGGVAVVTAIHSPDVNAGVTTFDKWFDQIRLLTIPDPAVEEVIYRFTSADVDIVYDGETYLGGKASRFRRLQPFRPGLAERSRSEIEVAIPRDHLIAGLVRGVRAKPIRVTILTLHRGDLADARTPLQGEVADCRDEGASCILTLAGKGARLDRKLPTLTTQRACTNTLYDSRCRVSESAFQYTGGVVTAIEVVGEGVIVTVSGAAAFPPPPPLLPSGEYDPELLGYFERGMLATADGFKVTIEAVNSVVGVDGHPVDGDQLTIAFAPPALVVGAAVTLSAGCSRAPKVCHFRFANLENFMGEPTIPIRNPFGPVGLVQG